MDRPIHAYTIKQRQSHQQKSLPSSQYTYLVPHFPVLHFQHPNYIPQVESKCRPRQNFDFVTHHRHLVKSRLAIEHHKIVVLHVSFNLYMHNSVTTLMDFSTTQHELHH